MRDTYNFQIQILKTCTMEEKDQQSAVEGTSIEALEKEFQDVLTEVGGEKTLEKFSVEYEKLIIALKKSQDNEKRLMTKCQKLKAEIQSNSAKVEAALKQSHEDQITITSLRKEIDKAHEKVDAANETKRTAFDTIKTMQRELDKLNELVKHAGLSSLEEGQTVDSILKDKKKVEAEKKTLQTQLLILQDNLKKAVTKQQETKEENTKAQKTIVQLQKDFQVNQEAFSRQTLEKEKLEEALEQLRADLETQQLEKEMLITQYQGVCEEKERMAEELLNQKVLNEKVSNKLEELKVHNTELQHEIEQKLLSLQKLTKENNQQASELMIERKEMSKMKQELAQQYKTKKLFCQMKDEKEQVEKQKDTLKHQVTCLKKEMEVAQKQRESDKMKINKLMHEKELLSRDLLKKTTDTEEQIKLVKNHEFKNTVLKQEILKSQDELQKRDKIIVRMEKERDRYNKETNNLTHKVLLNMEERKMQELEMFGYKKKIAEADTKLKQQENLYGEIRVERNNYSKSLLDAQTDIKDMQRKMQSMNEKNSDLIQEIQRKEAALAKEHLEVQRKEKQKEVLKAELQKVKQQAHETVQCLDNEKLEKQKLLKRIEDAEAEKVLQKRELNQVISERDILKTQLAQRNDELALISEKNKVHESILNKGRNHYNQRVQEIHLLKLEIKKLRSEKLALSNSVSIVEYLRQQIHHMQKDLCQEQAKCKRLQKLLENPINIHRWRRKEISDPSTFELIQKNQCLQRCLLNKSKEVLEKEFQLMEEKKLCAELKHIVN